jgi:hypothetical protein
MLLALSHLILLKATISKDPTIVENEFAFVFFLIHDKLSFLDIFQTIDKFGMAN